MGASGSLEKKKNKVEEFLRDRGFQQEIKFFFFFFCLGDSGFTRSPMGCHEEWVREREL